MTFKLLKTILKHFNHVYFIGILRTNFIEKSLFNTSFYSPSEIIS